jgi:hypothetical protein
MYDYMCLTVKFSEDMGCFSGFLRTGTLTAYHVHRMVSVFLLESVLYEILKVRLSRIGEELPIAKV